MDHISEDVKEDEADVTVWKQTKWRWMDRVRFHTTCYQCRLIQTERMSAGIREGC